MNRYPLWKYLLVVFIVTLGLVYATPNIYAPDPAIQISGSSVTIPVDQAILDKATGALDESNIEYFGVELTETNALIRLKTLEDQLAAQSAVEKKLGTAKYVVAVNLAPNTPSWLTGIGAGPMKLGLDLAGGVHFLLEVDTATVLEKELDDLVPQIRKALASKDLRSVKVRANKSELIFKADESSLIDDAITTLRREFNELEFLKKNQGESFGLVATLTDAYIREKEAFAVDQNLTALRNRVNEIGVAEPLVQRQGSNRIVVELPGLQDTARAKKIIGKTANLDFRLEANERTLASRREFFEYRSKTDRQRYGGAEVEKKSIIRGDRVTNANTGFDENGLPQVNITLDGEGGKFMHRATRNEIGRRMAVLFIEYETRIEEKVDENGEVQKEFTQIPQSSIISLATIQSGLGKQFRITGLDSPAEASELALLLRSGALAAPMAFVEERTIGPSLGKENVDNGVLSVQIGLSMVLIFMLFYYRVFGLAANIALTVNLVLLVAVMSIFGATLTLPGIAGIVLTVGMAVDANVLIFSRIREELKDGQPPQAAISNGFDRAYITIIDANITTFIVAIILWAIGSGPVKGFAVTLAIGIVTSVFTAIVGTRAIVNLFYGGRSIQKLWI